MARQPKWRSRFAVGLFALLFAAPAHSESHLEKLRWIEKAARVLRAGDGLSPDEDTSKWLSLPRERVAAELMSDPRFAETMLDFNLFFWGVRMDTPRRSNSSYARGVFSVPQTIHAARVMSEGGDYFSALLSMHQPLYFRPLNAPDPHLPGDAGKKPEELLPLMIERTQRNFDEVIAKFQANPKMPREEMRELINQHFEESDWYYFGVTSNFIQWAMRAAGWYGELFLAARSTPLYAKTDVLKELLKIHEVNKKFFALLPSLARPTYVTRSLKEIRILDVAALGVTQPWTVLNRDVNLVIPNSSTNFNRKRAAFFLGRFFCDDLTPIGVSAPEGHAGGRHASEPSCRACHYKLDPMAGFFRNFGNAFMDFSPLPYIRLEDDVYVDHDTYQKPWLAEPGAGRKWDVGYVRSDLFPERNDYGESIDDLFAIIRRAPETKRCLVKRLFEYLVSDNQTLDAGYLDWLTEEFTTTAKTDSTRAIRDTITRIVTSQSFSVRDPRPDDCYDYPPGKTPGDGPPCRVAAVLEKNCVSCHSASSNKGGLDVSRWIALGDGTKSFPHVDRQGVQKPREVTLKSIIERISTGDAEERMPYKKFMSATDREQIYLWARKEAESKRGQP